MKTLFWLAVVPVLGGLPQIAHAQEALTYADFNYVITVETYDPGVLIHIMDDPDTDEELEFILDVAAINASTLKSAGKLKIDTEDPSQVPTIGESPIRRASEIDGQILQDLSDAVYSKLYLELQPAEWHDGDETIEAVVGRYFVPVDLFPLTSPLQLVFRDIPLFEAEASNHFLTGNEGNTWAKTVITLKRSPKDERDLDRLLVKGSFLYWAEEWWANEDHSFPDWKIRKELLDRAMKYANLSPTERVNPFWAEEVRARIEKKAGLTMERKVVDYLSKISERWVISEDEFFKILDLFDPENRYGLRMSKLDEEPPQVALEQPESDEDFFHWFIESHKNFEY